MIITTSIEVGFLIPEENEEIKKFNENNDMRMWKQSLSSWCVNYTQKSILTMDYKDLRENDSYFKPTFE